MKIIAYELLSARIEEVISAHEKPIHLTMKTPERAMTREITTKQRLIPEEAR